MKIGTSTTATDPDPALQAAPAQPGVKVANRTWQRRVLAFDGLLIALLGWLLWTLYTDRSKPVEPQKTQLEVEAPGVGAPAAATEPANTPAGSE